MVHDVGIACPLKYLKVHYGLVLFKVDILIRTEILREGDAGEILAPLALLGRHRVEHGQQGAKHQHGRHQANNDGDDAARVCAFLAVKGNIGHEGVGEQEAGEEADNVGVVVHPGQQAEEQQQHQDQKEFPWVVIKRMV